MSAAHAAERERLLTIGAVCERLKGEFQDISISFRFGDSKSEQLQPELRTAC